MGQDIEQTDQRWSHGSLAQFGTVNWPSTIHRRGTFGFEVRFFQGQGVFLYVPIAGPNPTQGWKVKSVMLRYIIWAQFSEFGFADRLWALRVMDAENVLSTFGNLNYGLTNGYENLKLELPEPKSFNYGLSVEIVLLYDWFIGPPLIYEF